LLLDLFIHFFLFIFFLIYQFILFMEPVDLKNRLVRSGKTVPTDVIRACFDKYERTKDSFDFYIQANLSLFQSLSDFYEPSELEYVFLCEFRNSASVIVRWISVDGLCISFFVILNRPFKSVLFDYLVLENIKFIYVSDNMTCRVRL